MKKGFYLSIWLLLFIFMNTCTSQAKEKDYMNFKFGVKDDFILTNAKAEKLIFKNGEYSGSMKVYSSRYAMGYKKMRIKIDKSSKFIYKTSCRDCSITISDGSNFANCIFSNVDSIMVSFHDGKTDMDIIGNDIEFYTLLSLSYDENYAYSIEGTGSNVSIRDNGEKLSIKNLTSKCEFISDDLQFNKNSERKTRFYPTSSGVTLQKLTSKNVKVTGGLVYAKKKATRVEGLKAIPINETTMAISFNPVQKAKGYDVYRYDDIEQKYQKVTTLKGNKNTIWVDENCQKEKIYQYKIRPYKMKNKKQTYMKMSYVVRSITQSATMANVSKVTLNKTGTLELKNGKALKLKAKVKGQTGMKLLDKSVRWFTRNKKIATVDKNGKIKVKKKGKVKIYAKAHNGKNSKAVIIIVK